MWACRGDGIIKIEMHFLPDVTFPVSMRQRYNRRPSGALQGQIIADVLAMTVEACDFFRNIPRLARKLQTLVDVGLGYIDLGQPATTCQAESRGKACHGARDEVTARRCTFSMSRRQVSISPM